MKTLPVWSLALVSRAVFSANWALPFAVRPDVLTNPPFWSITGPTVAPSTFETELAVGIGVEGADAIGVDPRGRAPCR